MIQKIPWPFVQGLHRWARRKFFTTPKPGGPFVYTDLTIDELKRHLGGHGYAPNWEFSYNYRGEDLNLANVLYRDGKWWQVHFRAWDLGDTRQLNAHWELEPTEHPTGHLNGEGYDNQLGMNMLKEDLDGQYHVSR